MLLAALPLQPALSQRKLLLEELWYTAGALILKILTRPLKSVLNLKEKFSRQAKILVYFIFLVKMYLKQDLNLHIHKHVNFYLQLN